MPTGITPLCAHCGRPVLSARVAGYGGELYHVECTQSPYVAKPRHIASNPAPNASPPREPSFVKFTVTE